MSIGALQRPGWRFWARTSTISLIQPSHRPPHRSQARRLVVRENSRRGGIPTGSGVARFSSAGPSCFASTPSRAIFASPYYYMLLLGITALDCVSSKTQIRNRLHYQGSDLALLDITRL